MWILARSVGPAQLAFSIELCGNTALCTPLSVFKTLPNSRLSEYTLPCTPVPIPHICTYIPSPGLRQRHYHYPESPVRPSHCLPISTILNFVFILPVCFLKTGLFTTYTHIPKYMSFRFMWFSISQCCYNYYYMWSQHTAGRISSVIYLGA